MKTKYENKIERKQVRTLIKNLEKRLNKNPNYEVLGTTELPIRLNQIIFDDNRIIEFTKFDKSHKEMPKNIRIKYLYFYRYDPKEPRFYFYDLDGKKEIKSIYKYIKKSLL